MSRLPTVRFAPSLAVVAVLVASTAAPAVATSHDSTPALQVALRDDGSAVVTLRLTYDLQDDARRAAFRELRDDAAARRARADAFGDRMRGVADAIADDTGRRTSVSNATVALSTAGDDRTGVVALSVTVDGFAATAGDRLRVDSPFAGGFVTDRPLVLVAPDGDVATGADPAPDEVSASRSRLRWATGRDLTGFDATFAPQGSSAADRSVLDERTTTGSGPGLAVLAALAALVAFAAGVATLRRS